MFNAYLKELGNLLLILRFYEGGVHKSYCSFMYAE